MMDARPSIERSYTADDLRAIALAVANAYKGCNDFMRLSPVTANFPIGQALRPHLINAFVDHALLRMANEQPGFHHEIRSNVANNCEHVRLFKGRLALTAHYMGARDFRSGARHAEYRAYLAQRNLNLFEDEEPPDITADGGYVQLLHGGGAVPKLLMLAFPDEEETIVAGMPLEIPPPTTVEAEEIRDEFEGKLKQQQRDEEGGHAGEKTG